MELETVRDKIVTTLEVTKVRSSPRSDNRFSFQVKPGRGVIVVVIIYWFAILFAGRYPKDLFNFVVGTMRWTIWVEAYALLLVTDRYPPFSFSP